MISVSLCTKVLTLRYFYCLVGRESGRSLLTGGPYLEPVKPVYNELPKMSLYRGVNYFEVVRTILILKLVGPDSGRVWG
jgi:hypothetical protein